MLKVRNSLTRLFNITPDATTPDKYHINKEDEKWVRAKEPKKSEGDNNASKSYRSLKLSSKRAAPKQKLRFSTKCVHSLRATK